MLKLALIGLCAGSLALNAVALAAPAAKARTQERATLNLDNTKKALESGDEAQALAALDEIEKTADRRAAPLVEALLARGANSTLLLRARRFVDALESSCNCGALSH